MPLIDVPTPTHDLVEALAAALANSDNEQGRNWWIDELGEHFHESSWDELENDDQDRGGDWWTAGRNTYRRRARVTLVTALPMIQQPAWDEGYQAAQGDEFVFAGSTARSRLRILMNASSIRRLRSRSPVRLSQLKARRWSDGRSLQRRKGRAMDLHDDQVQIESPVYEPVLYRVDGSEWRTVNWMVSGHDVPPIHIPMSAGLSPHQSYQIQFKYPMGDRWWRDAIRPNAMAMADRKINEALAMTTAGYLRRSIADVQHRFDTALEMAREEAKVYGPNGPYVRDYLREARVLSQDLRRLKRELRAIEAIGDG